MQAKWTDEGLMPVLERTDTEIQVDDVRLLVIMSACEVQGHCVSRAGFGGVVASVIFGDH